MLLIADEEIGGVDAGGTGTDDGDAQWSGHLLETFRAHKGRGASSDEDRDALRAVLQWGWNLYDPLGLLKQTRL
ncbi:hypothetical protein GCM10027580_16300 [Corynebacterium faecale]